MKAAEDNKNMNRSETAKDVDCSHRSGSVEENSR